MKFAKAMPKNQSIYATTTRVPVVTVMGHVDHGKTTLLDTIRKTNIATQEHGSITQHIGAYQIEVKSKKFITFIDTPGHEAFAKMRARGAQVADIAILVVAANDGVLPQTIESIAHIKAAKIPCIVAINKIDLPGILPDKIKKQLTKAGLTLEEYGGETPVVLLSAKTGKGVDKLLDTILLIADLFPVLQENAKKVVAAVIESSLSKNKGPIATAIVRSATLQIGQELVCEDQEFRIRALIDFKGNNVNTASAGDPVELLGWKKLPLVGSIIHAKDEVELSPRPQMAISQEVKPIALTIVPKRELAEEKIKIIIKADTAGTLEAISSGLGSNLEVIGSGVGTISESDILLAKTTGSIVVGFHQALPANVAKLAQSEKVLVKTYNLIYELFKEIEEVAEAIKQGNLVEILGEAKIVALFPYDNETVAGVKVISGRIARGDQVKVMRADVELGRSRIKSLREHKKDITRAEQGREAGLILAQKIDFLTGDSIISIG